jgi:hypothetical protein
LNLIAARVIGATYADDFSVAVAFFRRTISGEAAALSGLLL